MRRTIILSFVLCLFISLSAQQDVSLPGTIVEQNSKFNTGKVNYLSNVQVKSPGASPQLSDGKGKFTLIFPDQPFGNVTRVFARKSGYVVVNEEELKNASVLGRKVSLKIVMCEEDKLYDNQIAYYKIARDATLEAYRKRNAVLAKEGRERELLIAQMQVEYNQEIKDIAAAKAILEQQLQISEARAKELADKFININLDDQKASYQRAFRAFTEEKNIEKALAIMDSVDLKYNLERRAENIAKLDSLKAIEVTELKKDVNECVFKARLHQLNYEFEKADSLFELALSYDKSNTQLAYEYAYFLQKQNNYKKAKDQYSELLLHFRKAFEQDSSALPDLAKVLNGLGGILNDNKELDQAEVYFKEALSHYRTLVKKNPEVYSLGVSFALNNLGVIANGKNEQQQAISYFEEALEVYKSLGEESTRLFLSEKANTLNNLGVLLRSNNQLTKARKAYKEAIEVYKLLAKKKPDVYLPQIAITLVNLGGLYYSINDLDSTRMAFEEALATLDPLAEKNPGAYLPYKAGVLSNLGILYDTNQEHEKAQNFYEEALDAYRDLAKENPAVYTINIASTLLNYGSLLLNNNLAAAKDAYEEALEIYKKEDLKNPGAYTYHIAFTLNNMGTLYFRDNQIAEAQNNFKASLDLYRQLAEQNPDAYLPGVAKNLNNLGTTLKKNNNFKEAKAAYKESLTIYREIYEKNPAAYSTQIGDLLTNYGGFLKENNDLKEAKVLFEEAISIYKPLAQKSPNAFNIQLSKALLNLGSLYQDLFEKKKDQDLKKEGLQYAKEAQEALSIYPSDFTSANEVKKEVDILIKFFSNN